MAVGETYTRHTFLRVLGLGCQGGGLGVTVLVVWG